MRKLVAVAAMGAIAAMSLAACGAAPKAGGDAAGKKANYTACLVSDNGGFQDKSFNQSAHEGLEKAAKDFGITAKYAQSKTDSDFVPNVQSMVSQKCDLIIGVGFLLNDAIRDNAKANTKTNFALIDSVISEKDFKPSNLPNAKPLVFDTAQAAYLAGYAAASMTKTGKLGTYVGMKLPTTDIFVDGFKLGMEKYNADFGKSVQLLGADQAVGDFSNTTKGRQITENLLAQGADIIMPVAGPVGLGTLSAMQGKADHEVVWVDADGYNTNPDYKAMMLTSVVKNIGEAVYDAVKEGKDGKFDAKPYVGTLENKGVSIAPFHDFDSKVSDEVKAKIKDLEKQIASGALKVESKNSPKV